MVEESWIRQLLTQVFGEFGGKMLRDVLRGEATAAGGIVAERVRELIKINPRAELLFVFLEMDPGEWENIRRAHQRILVETGNDNTWVRALGELLPKIEGRVDVERAKRVFAALNKMTADERDQMIEWLKHDPIAGALRQFWGSAVRYAAFGAAVANERLRLVNVRLREASGDIREDLEAEKGGLRRWTSLWSF